MAAVLVVVATTISSNNQNGRYSGQTEESPPNETNSNTPLAQAVGGVGGSGILSAHVKSK